MGALGFGFAHAFEPDHMAAVSAFVARRPHPREAALFGIRWALGHSVSLFLLGSVLFLIKRAAQTNQPQLFASGVLERVVGVVLIGLGLWTLFQVVSGRAAKHHQHGHFHDGHFHSHEDSHDETKDNDQAGAAHPRVTHRHTSGIASLGMGVLHGAAGTGAFVGQTVVSLSGSFGFVLVYTLFFSVGVLAAMGIYAGALGGLLSGFERRGTAVLNGARIATGILICAVGVCLVSGIALPGLFDRLMPH